MILNRLILQRLIKYLELDQLYKKKDDDPLVFVSQLQIPKEDYKPKLVLNESMELLISALASLLCVLLCFSIPYASLESPCEPLKDEGYLTLYNFAKSLEKYTFTMDKMIMILSVTLFVVSVVAITEAFYRIDFNETPWVMMGLYTLPERKADKEKKEKMEKEKKKIQKRYGLHFAHFRVNV